MKKKRKKKSTWTTSEAKTSGSQLIADKIRKLNDWRGETLSRVRRLIRDAGPAITEELKWRKPSNPSGVPVWQHDGIICTGETYKDKVKVTFARGATLKDPSRLFNTSLDAGSRRAIDIREGEKIDERAFKALIREAAALNTAKRKTKSA